MECIPTQNHARYTRSPRAIHAQTTRKPRATEADQCKHKGHFEVPLSRKIKTNHAQCERCEQTTVLGHRLSLATISKQCRQIREHYQKGRLTRLKQWFRDLTEMQVETRDLKFNKYLQDLTKAYRTYPISLAKEVCSNMVVTHLLSSQEK